MGGITWPKTPHAQSQFGGVNRPVTPVLFISTTVYARAALAWMKKKPNKNVHLEMRNLKQTELQRQKNRGKKEDREEGEPKNYKRKTKSRQNHKTTRNSGWTLSKD